MRVLEEVTAGEVTALEIGASKEDRRPTDDNVAVPFAVAQLPEECDLPVREGISERREQWETI